MVPDQDDRQALARDWITIWQSELSASATDRERAEAWSTFAAVWAELARAAACPAGTPRGDGPAGPAAATAPSGASAAAAASDGRDLALTRLAERVDALERRLAGLSPG